MMMVNHFVFGTVWLHAEIREWLAIDNMVCARNQRKGNPVLHVAAPGVLLQSMHHPHKVSTRMKSEKRLLIGADESCLKCIRNQRGCAKDSDGVR
jgi:hypothetical protein